MTTLRTTCKNAYWREARSCSNYSWHGFSPLWPAICSFKWQFLCEHLSHRVHFYGNFLNMVSLPSCEKNACVQHSTLPTNKKINTECTLQIFVMQKYHRNRWQPYEPHARTHIGEELVVVQITPDMVFLHCGQPYAPSSDSFYVIICHTGYISTEIS